MWIVRLKRKKVRGSSSSNALELKLLALTGILDELWYQVKSFDLISQKINDTPIDIVFWLYWLNKGLYHLITPIDWDKYVVVLQEKIFS